MRLYVLNRITNEKIYLKVEASTRPHLAKIIGKTFGVNGHKYSVNDVYAETGSSSTAAGAVVGGLLGILGGPIGILVAGGLGTIVGSGFDSDDKKKVRVFNNSHIWLNENNINKW